MLSPLILALLFLLRCADLAGALCRYRVNQNVLLGAVTRKLKWADGGVVRNTLNVRHGGGGGTKD